MLWLGSGVIGGIGLGLGYISPVSTLIKWFPDRRGMATGMAIMGFGGGALIGAPLANNLMTHFASPDSVGVWQTFVVMGVIYFVFMMGGALGYRVPPAGWQPEGWTQPSASKGMITSRDVDLKDAHRTPQFWMVWVVLCFNVSAGIGGVIGLASPILQEIFAGKLIGAPDVGFLQLDAGQKAAVAAIAAGFAGLLSLFNIVGRFFWASISDTIGRKLTYATFFVLGGVLYAGAPYLAHSGNRALFVLAFCIILSMYGGGFAAVPAYSGGSVRHEVRRRYPRPAADGLVDCRHSRACRRQLYPRCTDQGRHPAVGCLRSHDADPGRIPRNWLYCQPDDPASLGEMVHETGCCRITGGDEVAPDRRVRHRARRVLRLGADRMGGRRYPDRLGYLGYAEKGAGAV